MPVFHIGPERDHGLFAGLDAPRTGPIDQAAYVVLSGLFDDETETPDDYRPTLEKMLRRAMPMICANPDLVVERGDQLVYCAGAIADLYEKLGGAVLYAGKPHVPVYDLALATARSAARRAGPARAHHRDRRFGAHRPGRRERGRASTACSSPRAFTPKSSATARAPDLAKLASLFAVSGVHPRAVMRALAW